MNVVVFDTNALLMPFQFNVNPYEGVKDLVPGAELLTLEECVMELKGLKPRKWKSILSLGLQNGLKVVPSGLKGLVDDVIVEFAKKHQALVLTQDKLLKKKLLNNSLRLVVMRQKKRFMIVR